MVQIKKGLCTLVIGLFSTLLLNAQTGKNLVKNGSFGDGTKGTTEHWQLKGSGSGSLTTGSPRTLYNNPNQLIVKNTKKGDYVYQKIDGISATDFKLSFAVAAYYNYVNVELVWNNGEKKEVYNNKNFVDKLIKEYSNDYWEYDSYYWWYPNGKPEGETQVIGKVPAGATSVEIRFLDGGAVESEGQGDFEAFYVDDVVFELSGKATPAEPLEAPQNVKVSNVAKNKFTLSWDAIKNATSYIVKANGGTHTVTGTSYEVTGLSAGTKYSIEISGTSDNTKKLDNKITKIDVYTLSEVKADGANVFFDEGDFEQGSSKGWVKHNNITIDKSNIGGNGTAKLRIQNESTALVARSFDFSVEGNTKYTFFVEAYTPEDTRNGVLAFNVVWKKANGERIATKLIESTSEKIGETWEILVNELTSPEEAVIAEIQFQLPSGDNRKFPVFYVDNVKVIKGQVAPFKVEVKDIHQRNAMLSWAAIKDMSYKVIINGKNFEAKDGMLYMVGLEPNTDYTAEIFATDVTNKKTTVNFKTTNFSHPEGERIAYLANIDESGNIASEFYYNIEDLEGKAITNIEFIFNSLPATVKDGYVILPNSTNGKLVVKVTQEGGEVTTLTYSLITKK